MNIFNEICCKSKGKDIERIKGIKLNSKITENLFADIFGPEYEDEQKLDNLMQNIYMEKDFTRQEKYLNELNEYINNTSIVLRLHYQEFKILLGGDVYNSYWKNLLEKQIPIDADIIKLPHHGHMDSVSEEMLQAIRPEYVVISVSNDRQDSCPNPGVIDLFYKVGLE